MHGFGSQNQLTMVIIDERWLLSITIDWFTVDDDCSSVYGYSTIKNSISIWIFINYHIIGVQKSCGLMVESCRDARSSGNSWGRWLLSWKKKWKRNTEKVSFFLTSVNNVFIYPYLARSYPSGCPNTNTVIFINNRFPVYKEVLKFIDNYSYK